MERKPEHIATLTLRVLKGEATKAEQEELNTWLQEDKANQEWLGKVMQEAYIPATLKDLTAAQARTTERLKQAGILMKPEEQELHIQRRHTGKGHRWFVRYAAAAVLLLAAAFGGYFYKQSLRQDPAPRMATRTPGAILAPSSNRAMITLADGSEVFLDSTGNGQLAQQGTIKLVKLANGQIAYLHANAAVSPAPAGKQGAFNTLTNPRGSKVIDMQLSDGSHVWLNAGSAITYPVAFTGNERKVELKGEGYFEVAKDKTRKFIVASNGVTTEVLGTHFNVNAYSNEPAIRVTLLEGSVRTGNNNSAVVIKPGQQAITGNGSVKVNKSPDLDQVMAWKNGYFSFDGLTLKQAMTQLERWYDIDVVYEGDVADEGLMGKMTRGITLNELMDVLQKIGVHYQLEGRKLIIKK